MSCEPVHSSRNAIRCRVAVSPNDHSAARNREPKTAPQVGTRLFQSRSAAIAEARHKRRQDRDRKLLAFIREHNMPEHPDFKRIARLARSEGIYAPSVGLCDIELLLMAVWRRREKL